MAMQERKGIRINNILRFALATAQFPGKESNSRSGVFNMADTAVRKLGTWNSVSQSHKIEATSRVSHFCLGLTLIRKVFLVF